MKQMIIIPVLAFLSLSIRPLHAEGNVTVSGTWTADMSRSIVLGGFTIGDSLYVRINDHGGLQRDKRMIRLGTTFYYRAWDTLGSSLNDTVKYYYIVIRNDLPRTENDSLLRTVVVSSSSFSLYDTSSCSTCERRKPLFSITNVALQPEVPLGYELYQNFPNPFNPNTIINYKIASQSQITLKIFDMLGREIALLVNTVEPPGFKSVSWDASRVSSGAYFYRLKAGNFVATKRMSILK